MDVIIFDCAEDVVKATAARYKTLVDGKPTAVLGLSNGDTESAVYKELVEMYRLGLLSFRQTTCFNLNERLPIEGNAHESYSKVLKRNLFDLVDVKPQNVYMQTFSSSASGRKNTHRYEQIIHSCGGIDLQTSEIGADGRVGFNEPQCHLASRTRVRRMLFYRPLDNQNRGRVANSSLVMTLGIGTILESHSVLITAIGRNKSTAVYDAVEGPISKRCPASALQLHNRVTYLLDQTAASKLTNLDSYYHAKANELCWVGSYGNFYSPDHRISH